MIVKKNVRIIIYSEDERWVAQCLEYDIGAQAKTLGELSTILELTLSAEFNESIERHGEPFVGIDPAPVHFHEMWESRSGAYTPVTNIDEHVSCQMAMYG